MTSHDSSAGPRRDIRWRATLAKLAALVLLVLAGNLAASWLVDRVGVQIWPEHLEIVDRALLAGAVLYILLMATPFLPGIEIGLALMMLLGARGVVLVYACTLAALAISFGLGRLFPPAVLVRALQWLNLARAAALLQEFASRPPQRRLESLAATTSARAMPALLRHRYLLLAVLLNLPGNALIGGGGGIAMLAGMSRLYSFPAYCLLIAVAILPGPLLITLSSRFA